MVAPTRTRIVKIGKSKGVRIPQKMLDQVGLRSEVELAATYGRIVIQPVLLRPRHPRQGWKKSFKKMAKLGDDRLLDTLPISTKWDDIEWQW